jgi:iron complex outermembrane recepter protein
MYTNTYEISDLYKQKYSFALRYLVASNFSSPVYELNDSTKVLTTTYNNIGTRYAWEAEFYIPVTLTRWWSINTDFDAAYEKYVFNADSAHKNTFELVIKLNQDFILPGGIKGQIIGSYENPVFYGIKQYQHVLRFDAGLSKAVMNNKATLKLGVNDIFNSDWARYTSNYQGIDLSGKEKGGTRFVVLSFNYRFGKQSAKSATKRTGGNTADQERLSGGDN